MTGEPLLAFTARRSGDAVSCSAFSYSGRWVRLPALTHGLRRCRHCQPSFWLITSLNAHSAEIMFVRGSAMSPYGALV